MSLRDATALLTGDRIENNLGLPATSFSLKQVNSYLKFRNAQNNTNSRMITSLAGKMNNLLGQKFYISYQWVNPEDRPLTALDIHYFLAKNSAEILEPNVAPWPCTLMPRHFGASVKYQSVFKNGVEFVARTVCDRQGPEFFTDSTQMFTCAVCGDVLGTPYHVILNCYIFKPNFSFQQLLDWRDTFQKACFLHWKLEGVTMPGRNLYQDAKSGRAKNNRGNWRGRGNRRGTFVRSLFS